MRALRFYKISPGGNPTILILDPVPSHERVAVAQRLLAEDHLQAEQVGYLDLTADPVRLDMMGGEFCGNACRAAALVMLYEGIGLHQEKTMWRGVLSASGAEQPLRVQVEEADSHPCCWAEMFLPAPDSIHSCAPGMGLIHLPGISHLCLDETLHSFPAQYSDAARELRISHGLTTCEAAGCIWYQHQDHSRCQIRPVVWVRGTNSTYLETGCGSGSLAVALWLEQGKNFPTTYHIFQPSGESISVQIEAHSAWIFGPTRLIARGQVYL